MLFILLAMSVVSPVYAQGTKDIDFNEVIQNLGPRSGQDLLWDIFLYAIFLIGIVNMGLIPDKQLFPAMLNFGVIAMAVTAKLLVGEGESKVLDPLHFGTFVLNVGMFVLPLIIAGMVRSVKGKPSKAIFPAAFQGLLGGGHFFLYWYMVQRGLSTA
jgi:hypothetical protein